MVVGRACTSDHTKLMAGLVNKKIDRRKKDRKEKERKIGTVSWMAWVRRIDERNQSMMNNTRVEIVLTLAVDKSVSFVHGSWYISPPTVPSLMFQTNGMQ